MKILIEVMLDDIANLNNEEFKEAWEALGKIARARAKAQKPEEGE